MKVYILPSSRVYYNSRSNLPMLPDELERAGEQEEETLEWQKMCSQKVSDILTGSLSLVVTVWWFLELSWNDVLVQGPLNVRLYQCMLL